MEGELRAAEEKLKREHKEMKEAARAKREREKKILDNVQASRNRHSAARINASALRPREKPADEPASQFVPSEMKSGKEMKVTARINIKRERRILAAMLIEDALMTQERRPRALRAQEEKDGALGDGKDEGFLGQSKINLYIEDRKPVVHLDLEAARTRKPTLRLSESAIEDITRRMNKRSYDDVDGDGNGSSKDVKKETSPSRDRGLMQILRRGVKRKREQSDDSSGDDESGVTEYDDGNDHQQE